MEIVNDIVRSNTRHRAEPRERDDELDLVRAYLEQIARTPLLTADEEVGLAKRIEAGEYAAHVLSGADGKRRRLPAKRADLEAVAQAGAEAKDQMVRANLRLVVSVAKRYGSGGLAFLDLIQEGNLGLIRAVEKFDYRRGYKFSTYAMWWIRQAITRAIADQGRTIRLPVHVVEDVARIRRAERELVVQLGRDPTIEELAAGAGMAPGKVADLRDIARQPVSLDSPVGEDEETRLGDLIHDLDTDHASDVIEFQSLSEELRALVDTLPPREAMIISYRYGLHDGHSYNLQEIGDRLGLTRERIRQLEKQAMQQLRSPEHAERLLDSAS
jgi:RNA polymerase sigma factor (sigma-70 family)